MCCATFSCEVQGAGGADDELEPKGFHGFWAPVEVEGLPRWQHHRLRHASTARRGLF